MSLPTDPNPPTPQALPSPVVDGHTHLDLRRMDQPSAGSTEISALLARAAAVGVTRVVQIGCDVQSSEAAVRLAEQFPQVLAGVALHPNEAPRLAAVGQLAQALERIAKLAHLPRVAVIGETGLDYFRTGPEGIAAQQESFRWHIALAKERNLALQIHDRDAHSDVLRILAEEGAPERTIFHCFSGDAEMARECVAAGYFLSFSGTITFKNAPEVRAALAITPVGQLQVETDAPYLTPIPHRGQQNASYLLPHTVRAIAQIRAVPLDELCQSLSATAERLYGPWTDPTRA